MPHEKTDGKTFRVPGQIHFLLNDKCNARCVMCGGDYYRSASGRAITLEKFERMASNLRLERFLGIVLSGAGDPLLNSDFLPIVRFVNERYPGVAVAVTTNGIALDEELSRGILAHKVASINISINAATRETYRRVMQVDRFESVCGNVIDFLALANRGVSRPTVQLSCASHRLNIEELPRLVELGRNIGIDSINVMYCRFYPARIRDLNLIDESYRLSDRESLFHHQELSDRCVEEAKRLAQRFGIRLYHEPLFRENAPGRKCVWPETEIMVGFDGEIYPCGGAEVHFREKVEKGIYHFGNALHETIDEFWNNEMYRALRVSSRQGEVCLVPECRCCANTMRPGDVRSHIMRWEEEAAPPAVTPPPAKAPLVSVIVPTYNRPGMLAEALKSILAQTFTDFEAIVVNDAGEDVEAVVTGLNRGRNLTYVRHGKNRGLAAARNTGIRAARGKYIAYLDDDDRYYPDHLQTLVDALAAGDVRVAYTDACRVTQVKSDQGYAEIGRDVQYSFDFDYDRILVENFVPVLCFLHEKSCVVEAGYFDESLRTLEDWDLWIRMSRIHKFSHIPKVTCEYTWREDGSTMTSGKYAEFWDTVERIYGKYADVIKEKPELQALQSLSLKRVFSYKLINHAVALFKEGDLDGSIRELEGLLSVEGKHALAHKELGVIYHYKGDPDKALFHLERSVALEPGNPAAGKDLARLYLRLGRPEEAVTACENILREFPKDFECLMMLKQICTDMGMDDHARALNEKVLEILPDRRNNGNSEGDARRRAPGGPRTVCSVIIPVLERLKYTKKCIETLKAIPGEIDFELIVVDNGSRDGTSDYLKSLKDGATIITNEVNLGFAKACNMGAHVARGKYLVFLNNDTIPQQGWLEGLVRGAEAHGGDICGAKLLYPDGRVQHAGVAFYEPCRPFHIFNNFPADSPAANRKRFMQGVTAACMLVRRDLFFELGGFDEEYRNGFEDLDFCLRAQEGGRKILYTPESILIHFEESSEGRKDCDEMNMERFLARWSGKIKCDRTRWFQEEGYDENVMPGGDIHYVARSTDLLPQVVIYEKEHESKAVRSSARTYHQRTDTPEYFAALGKDNKARKRFAEALKAFESARRLGDDSVLTDMGDCLAQAGELGQAESIYREALRMNPGDGRAMVGLGMVHRMEGDSFGSVEYLKSALAADPLSLPALHQLVRAAHEFHRLEVAEEYLKGYLMHRPSDPNMLFTLAGVYCKEGKYEEALDALERLAVFSPEYEGAGDLKRLVEEAAREAAAGR